MSDLRKYTLKSSHETHEGWAIFLLDLSIGYFSVVSDFGNYSYIWSHPGCEFRKFLIGLEIDYLRGKLLHGRSHRDEFDGEATKKDILEAVEEYKKDNDDWEHYEHEKSLLEENSFESEHDFNCWLDETSLGDAYEYICRRPDRQCTAFCERVMPRLKELLKKELEEEANEKAQHEVPPAAGG